MNRMRYLVAILIIWLFLFYNIERLGKYIDLSEVAYIFVAAMVIMMMLFPNLHRVPLWALLGMPIPLFFVCKVFARDSMSGRYSALTMIELASVALTIFLTREFSMAVSEFENAVARMTIGQVNALPESSPVERSEIYREVRRARTYQRPLTLMAVKVNDQSIQVALERMVQEAQQAMIKQYVMSNVSQTLCDVLEDYNIIAKANGRFLVMLPEATPQIAEGLIHRVHKAVTDRVGVTLEIGIASLPEDAITFEGLMEKAIGQIEREANATARPQDSAKHTSTV